MEFRQLNTFVTAAQTESFSRAAQILGYSQSAVTVQIKLLEEELGVKLFDRLGKRISLTGEGQKLLKQSRQILKEVSQAKETAGQEGELCSPLHIGTVESLCSAKLPAVLNYFRACHPRVRVKVTTAPPARLYEMLEQNLLDLIYLLEAHNLSLAPALEISSTDFIIRHLKENGGISYLPYFAVEESVGKGELMVLKVKELQVRMYQQIFFHKSKWKTREMDAFIKKAGEISGK